MLAEGALELRAAVGRADECGEMAARGLAEDADPRRVVPIFRRPRAQVAQRRLDVVHLARKACSRRGPKIEARDRIAALDERTEGHPLLRADFPAATV